MITDQQVGISLMKCIHAVIDNRRHGMAGNIYPNWLPSNYEYGNIKAEVQATLNAAGVPYGD